MHPAFRLALFVLLLAIGWAFVNNDEIELSQDARDWLNAGKFFQFNGAHRIFYRDDTGEATAPESVVFLIHGFPTSSYDFVKILPFLRKRSAIFAFLQFYRGDLDYLRLNFLVNFSQTTC